MRNLKVISIGLAIIFLGVAITCNASSSSNNQAFASLDNNNDISDSIKKLCPTYQSNNNNNIKGLVTDILKACIPQGNQPPPTTPDPTEGTFTRNILNFQGAFNAAEEFDTAKIVITDTTNDLSITYNLGGEVEDAFVVPVGANYQVDVTTSSASPNQYEVEILATDCRQVGDTCIGTMGTTLQSIRVNINP